MNDSNLGSTTVDRIGAMQPRRTGRTRSSHRSERGSGSVRAEYPGRAAGDRALTNAPEEAMGERFAALAKAGLLMCPTRGSRPTTSSR
jgi:hypothetical protein